MWESVSEQSKTKNINMILSIKQPDKELNVTRIVILENQGKKPTFTVKLIDQVAMKIEVVTLKTLTEVGKFLVHIA